MSMDETKPTPEPICTCPARFVDGAQHADWCASAPALAARVAELDAEVARLREALRDAWGRMDRARNILTNGTPTPECNWGMLDTTLDRRALGDEK